MVSISSFQNNNQWLSTYKAHFVEMREGTGIGRGKLPRVTG